MNEETHGFSLLGFSRPTTGEEVSMDKLPILLFFPTMPDLKAPIDEEDGMVAHIHPLANCTFPLFRLSC